MKELCSIIFADYRQLFDNQIRKEESCVGKLVRMMAIECIMTICILTVLTVTPGCVAESASEVQVTPDHRSVNLIFTFGDLTKH